MKYNLFSCCMSVVVALFGVCTGPSITGDPGGTEITNGKVAARNGSPVSGLSVSAFPENYISGHSDASAIVSSVTDAQGVFKLAIDSGYYNLYVVDTVAGSGCFIRHVGPKQSLGTVLLDSLGTIEGMVRVDSASAVPIVIVYSKGTPLRVNISSRDGVFRFVRVPSGEYRLSIAGLPAVGCVPGNDCLPGTGGSEGGGNVTVQAGTTVTVDIPVHAAEIGPLP